MSGYFNSLFNTTASRVASIKQNLLPSENDGDTEDDTHICRVLRGYYTEKGRAFPAWLPPDPRAPPPAVVQPVYPQSNVGRGYGGLNQQSAAGGGQLSSLWDSQPQQPPQQDPQGGGRPGARGGAVSARATPARHNPFSRQQTAAEPQVQARPLPSQRAGSQQAVGTSPFSRPDSGGAMPVSAKDRLKGQFGQRRSGSPALSDQGQGYRNDSYSSSSSGRGYDSRSNATPYPTENYARGGSGGGGNPPLVSAASPWATNDTEFGGYEPAYDTRNNDRRQGLPSGPGAGKRGPGLPTGPRGPRY